MDIKPDELTVKQREWLIFNAKMISQLIKSSIEYEVAEKEQGRGNPNLKIIEGRKTRKFTEEAGDFLIDRFEIDPYVVELASIGEITKKVVKKIVERARKRGVSINKVDAQDQCSKELEEITTVSKSKPSVTFKDPSYMESRLGGFDFLSSLIRYSYDK